MLSIFLSSLTHGGCRPTQRQPPNSKTAWAKIVRTVLLACPLFSRLNSGFAHQRRRCRT
nr:MAG TPA: hypothetical protein [Caudoviricetes sp.]